MFKNMTPKQKVIIAIVAVIIIALIIFFVVRSRKKKKLYAENAEKKIGTSNPNTAPSEPTPAEGGKFRVIPDEDDAEMIPEEKPSPRPQNQQPANQGKRPQVNQKPHLNTSGKTRGGELPPMEEDLQQIRNDESSFTGVLFDVDQVVHMKKSVSRKK